MTSAPGWRDVEFKTGLERTDGRCEARRAHPDRGRGRRDGADAGRRRMADAAGSRSPGKMKRGGRRSDCAVGPLATGEGDVIASPKGEDGERA